MSLSWLNAQISRIMNIATQAPVMKSPDQVASVHIRALDPGVEPPSILIAWGV